METNLTKFVGLDEEGFAVYLFCGPMQPVKSFRIPAQVSK